MSLPASPSAGPSALSLGEACLRHSVASSRWQHYRHDIFAVRQMQEKCMEQSMGLYISDLFSTMRTLGHSLQVRVYRKSPQVWSTSVRLFHKNSDQILDLQWWIFKFLHHRKWTEAALLLCPRLIQLVLQSSHSPSCRESTVDPGICCTSHHVSVRSDHFIIWGGGAGRVFEKIIWRCFWPKKIIWPSLYVEKIFFALICCKKK